MRDEEIRYAGAIKGGREVLADRHVVGAEAGRGRFDLTHRPTRMTVQ